MKLLVSLILCLFFLSGCNKDDIYSENERLIKLDFPDCKLLEKKIIISGQRTEILSYSYENSLMVKRDYFSGNERATLVFKYDSMGRLDHVVNSDTLGNESGKLWSYTYENELLTKFTWHDLANGGKVLQEKHFTYVNGKISTMNVMTLSGNYNEKYSIKTDKFGNPVEIRLIESDGKNPKYLYKIVNKYDNKFNPYHLFPGFIEMNYFAQNNVIESKTYYNETVSISGQDIGYDGNSLLSKTFERFETPFVPYTETNEFIYKCD